MSLELTFPKPPEWMDYAVCREIGGNEWFPEKGFTSRHAKRMCQQCPVREVCLEYSIEENIVNGVWGGLGELERRPLRVERIQQKKGHAA